MMLPVWMGGWEWDCCGPDLSVGDRLDYGLVAEEIELFAEPATTEPAGWRGTPDGRVEFTGVLAAYLQGTPTPSLLRIGDLSLLALGPSVEGSVRGVCRVWSNRHDWSGDAPRCDGIIRSLQRVTPVFERVGPRELALAGREAPVTISTTAERGDHDDVLAMVEIIGRSRPPQD